MLSIHRIRKYTRRIGDLHPGVLAVVLLLSLLGLTMQLSASGGNPRLYAIPQAIYFGMGLILMLVIAVLPPRLLLRSSYLIYGGCVLLLVVAAAVGTKGMGAQRWIDIGIFRIQPSEPMKVGIILAIACYFHSVTLEGTRHWMIMFIPALLTLVPVALILKQPNLGTATIVAIIAFAMCFLAGIRWWYFAGVIAAVVAAVPVGYQFLHGYQKRRVMTFLNPDSDPLGAGYNIIQSKIAIGSGGFLGKGLFQGSQGQLDFLPEKQTDFIFTMLAEELGFIGVIVLMMLYAFLLVFALTLSVRCRSTYGRLLAAGVATMFFAHIFINTAMVMGMIPVVGVPLPFLSYGGSFMLAALMAAGVLLHVHLNAEAALPKSGGF